ncbi:MAG: hypothetical protein M3220_21400 [Chloroflexota bacterium]|nr:hypothetical protein [Chloroflexota bacterium]
MKWQRGCLQIEVQEAQGSNPLEDWHARVIIEARAEDGKEGTVQAEGELGVQLVHLLHACVVLSDGEGEEWFVPSSGHPLHLRRHGRHVEIARYPTYVSYSPQWLTDDGLYLVDFGMLVASLSAAVEWVMTELTDDYAEDDTVQILLLQWERAWQRFSRLATFRRVTLMPV